MAGAPQVGALFLYRSRIHRYGRRSAAARRARVVKVRLSGPAGPGLSEKVGQGLRPPGVNRRSSERPAEGGTERSDVGSPGAAGAIRGQSPRKRAA